MGLPVVQNQGGLGDIAQLLQSLGPLFGSGKTGTSNTKTSSAKDGDLSQADDLIQQILGSVSDDKLDVLTQNILERAKQTFAPANISSSAAGVRGYSDTVHKDLQNQAMAKATAEAMSVRLQAQGAAQKTAASVVDTKLQTNKTVAEQQQTKTGASPAGKGLALLTPAALLLNQFNKKKTTGVTNTTPPQTDNSGVEDINSAYGNPGGADVSGGGGFPPQDFGNESLILNPTESNVPPPLDFGDVAPLASEAPIAPFDPIADISADAPADDLSIDDGADAPIDIPSDAPVDDVDPSLFDDFDLSDVDFFADGGIVQPGTRGKPSSYTDEATVKKTVNAPRLSNEPAISSDSAGGGGAVANSPVVARALTTNSRRNLVSRDTNVSQGDLTNSLFPQDGSLANAVTDSPSATAPAGIGLGLSVANAALGIGAPAIGAMIAIAQLLANNGIGDGVIGGNIGNATLGSMTADDSLEGGSVATGIGGIGGDAGNTSDAAAASNAATAGESGAPAGDTPGGDASPGGDNGDSVGGDTGGDGGSTGGGDGGGGGGDGEFDGGIQDSDSAKESSGVDKKLIHVTPGESVLPVDTTKVLQSLFGEDVIEQLIAATHTPLKRNANGRR